MEAIQATNMLKLMTKDQIPFNNSLNKDLAPIAVGSPHNHPQDFY